MRLADAAKRRELIDSLVTTSVTWGWEGLDVDYEAFAGWKAPDYTRYVTFLRSLAAAMHQRGRLLSVCTNASANDSGLSWQSLLGGSETPEYHNLDQLRIMVYDLDWSESTPRSTCPVDGCSGGPYSTLTRVLSKVRDATNGLGHEQKSRIVIGLPLWGYLWRQSDGWTRTDEGRRFKTAVQDLQSQPRRVQRAPEQGDVPYYAWNSGAATAQIWFEDAASISRKLECIGREVPFAGGVMFWRAGYSDPDLVDVLSRFQADTPSYWPAMPRKPFTVRLYGQRRLDVSPPMSMEVAFYRKDYGHFLPRGAESALALQRTITRLPAVLPVVPGSVYAVASIAASGLEGGWVEAEDFSLSVVSHSPVDVRVQFPDGTVRGADQADGESVAAATDDLDGDGDQEDLLAFAAAQDGAYILWVTPRAQVNGEEEYALDVHLNGQCTRIAEPTRVADIPLEGYRFRVSEGQILTGTTPPSTGLSVSPGVLWPPNGRMCDLVLDYDTALPGQHLRALVTCNEPDFDAQQDVERVDARTIRLRAKRNGNNPQGRVYTITLTGADGSQVSDPATVLVPHDQGVKAGHVTGAAATQTVHGAQVVVTLASDASLSAEVLNIAGRVVRRVCTDKEAQAGANTLLWDGNSEFGTQVPNGHYIVRIVARTVDGTQSQAVVPLMIQR